MTTEEAKELLKELKIDPDFDVLEWSPSVWSILRQEQLRAYGQRQFTRAEELCELERVISANGGSFQPWPVDCYYFSYPARR